MTVSMLEVVVSVERGVGSDVIGAVVALVVDSTSDDVAEEEMVASLLEAITLEDEVVVASLLETITLEDEKVVISVLETITLEEEGGRLVVCTGCSVVLVTEVVGLMIRTGANKLDEVDVVMLELVAVAKKALQNAFSFPSSNLACFNRAC